MLGRYLKSLFIPNQQLTEYGMIKNWLILFFASLAAADQWTCVHKYYRGHACNITEILEDENSEVEISGYDKLADVKTLFIYSNNLRVMPSSVFQLMPELIILEIHNSSMENINDDTFGGATVLEEILFYKNYELKSIASNSLKHLLDLKVFEIEYSQIEYLDENLFSANLNLTRISFLYNNLTILSSDMFQHLTELNQLNLKGNDCVNMTFSDLQQLKANLLKCHFNLLEYKLEKEAPKECDCHAICHSTLVALIILLISIIHVIIKVYNY